MERNATGISNIDIAERHSLGYTENGDLLDSLRYTLPLDRGCLPRWWPHTTLTYTPVDGTGHHMRENARYLWNDVSCERSQRGRSRRNQNPSHTLVAQLDLERFATNEKVTGSNPVKGIWPYRLSARTFASQAKKMGSIPIRAIWKVGEDGASHLFAKQASLIRTVGSNPTLSA